MFRLLGILIGSAASVAAIFFFTGLSGIHFKDPAIDQERFDEAVADLMARNREANRVISEQTKAVAEAAETAEMADMAERKIPPADVPPPVNDPPPLNEMQWHSFWNPFRTEIAASGFVSRLEEVTGLDYRVVKLETGAYEVAFAYGDDDERRVKLSQISAATGLDLPDQ